MLDLSKIQDALRIAIEVKTEKLFSADERELSPDEVYDLIREIKGYRKQLKEITDSPYLSFPMPSECENLSCPICEDEKTI